MIINGVMLFFFKWMIDVIGFGRKKNRNNKSTLYDLLTFFFSQNLQILNV